MCVYVCVCMCVCVPLKLFTTSGIIWILYDWLNTFYSFYMAAIVVIISRCGLRGEAYYKIKTKLMLLYPVTFTVRVVRIVVHKQQDRVL